MKTASVFFASLLVISASHAGDNSAGARSAKLEGTYEGVWVTTKTRKLDGTATCEVKQLSKDQWQGRFSGQWQQMPFEYTADFSADHDQGYTRLAAQRTGSTGAIAVKGKATIDGAYYDFAGELSPRALTLQFTGDRYEGAVLLKRVDDKKPKPPVATK